MKKLDNKEIKFIRWGGLSLVKQKGYRLWDTEKESYHTPPAKYGIYAFVYPYIDIFFLGGYKETKNNHVQNKNGLVKGRIFEYYGNIWHHLEYTVNKNNIIDKKGSWVYTDFDTWYAAIKKEFHMRRQQNIYIHPNKENYHTYNPTNNISVDNLEIFISDKI